MARQLLPSFGMECVDYVFIAKKSLISAKWSDLISQAKAAILYINNKIEQCRKSGLLRWNFTSGLSPLTSNAVANTTRRVRNTRFKPLKSTDVSREYWKPSGDCWDAIPLAQEAWIFHEIWYLSESREEGENFHLKVVFFSNAFSCRFRKCRGAHCSLLS